MIVCVMKQQQLSHYGVMKFAKIFLSGISRSRIFNSLHLFHREIRSFELYKLSKIRKDAIFVLIYFYLHSIFIGSAASLCSLVVARRHFARFHSTSLVVSNIYVINSCSCAVIAQWGYKAWNILVQFFLFL